MKHESIIESIESYLKEDPVSFHVPGHKNGRGLSDLMHLDVTEIPGTDNLHHPEEAILSTKQRASDIFGTKSTYFLVNGTTGGNHAMILAATVPGDHILIARNVHKSVHTGCVLGGLKPEYVYPQIHPDLGIPMGVTPEAIRDCLEMNRDIKAVVITSPTYEGVHCDIESISQVVHDYGALLLVDEAHGAHISLHEAFGLTATDQGADLSVQSTHKSMNALTQASMLHVGSDAVDLYKLESWLSMLQSSSPSYVLMSSLEASLDAYGGDGKEQANTLVENLKKFKAKTADELGLKVLCAKDVEKFGFGHDMSKLVIFMDEAEKAAEKLRSDFGIQVEYATADSLVCLTSIYNTPSDFDRLYNALEALSVQPHRIIKGLTVYPRAQAEMSPKDAFYSPKMEMELKESSGRICAEYVIPYPPGVPLLSPGEVITEEVVSLIRKWKAQGHSVIGTKDETLKNILVIK